MRHNCFVRDWSGDPRQDKFMDKVEFSLIECNLTKGLLIHEYNKRRASRSEEPNPWQKSVSGSVEPPRNYNQTTPKTGKKNCVGEVNEFICQAETKIELFEAQVKRLSVSPRFKHMARELRDLLADALQKLYSLKYADLSDWSISQEATVFALNRLEERLVDVGTKRRAR